MDPDAALARMRELMEQIKESKEPVDEIAENVYVAFCGLDAWLTGGGFLPAPWARRS